MKSKQVAYFLWVIGICGCLGLHRFYLGKTKSGLLWLFSGGVLGIGSLVDLISLGEQVRQVNSLRILEKLACGQKIAEFQQQHDGETVHAGRDSSCPYCMGVLKRQPRHNIKCPFCQKEIYVRLEPLIFDGTLLTAEDALVADHLRAASRFGLTAADFTQKRAELRAKFGAEITSADVFWSLLERVIQETHDDAELKRIYRRVALFLKDLKQDLYYIVQRAAKMQLVEIQRDKYIKKVRIIAASGACPACRQLDGKIYSLEEAIQLMPLPCKRCTNQLSEYIEGFCRCYYQAEP